MDKETKCVIFYKTGINQNGFTQGIRFETIDECCNKFSYWFINSGNSKTGSFSKKIGQIRKGLNFMSYFGEKVTLFLFITSFSDVVNFCPFCGAEVLIEESKRVKLISEYERKFKGYVEELIVSN